MSIKEKAEATKQKAKDVKDAGVRGIKLTAKVTAVGAVLVALQVNTNMFSGATHGTLDTTGNGLKDLADFGERKITNFAKKGGQAFTNLVSDIFTKESENTTSAKAKPAAKAEPAKKISYKTTPSAAQKKPVTPKVSAKKHYGAPVVKDLSFYSQRKSQTYAQLGSYKTADAAGQDAIKLMSLFSKKGLPGTTSIATAQKGDRFVIIAKDYTGCATLKKHVDCTPVQKLALKY